MTTQNAPSTMYRDREGLGLWEHRGKIAAVGIGHSPTARRWDGTPDTTVGALAIDALRKAIDDAGVNPEEIDGLVMDSTTRMLDLDDDSITENTRGSYPLRALSNISSSGCGERPNCIFFLTADAFGVLPPLAKLTVQQAMYYFISGYTAKLAGTERGVLQPEATFSTCFGAPFMPRHPSVYANLLRRRMSSDNVQAWLVNTGWTGGAYGIGSRIQLKYTRAMVNAILEGKLDKPQSHYLIKVMRIPIGG